LAKVKRLFGASAHPLRRKRGFTSYSKGFDLTAPPTCWQVQGESKSKPSKLGSAEGDGRFGFPVKKRIDFRDNVDPHGDSRIASGEGSWGCEIEVRVWLR